MYKARQSPPIDRYSGPYERWIFSEELGRPFAFPVLRASDPVHFTAMLEGDNSALETLGTEARIPPLWPGLAAPSVTPFAFRTSDTADDAEIVRQIAPAAPTRMRVNFPVDPAAWPTRYTPGTAPQDWDRSQRPKVIIGVIDDALPFAHRAFAGATGTRISSLWLQSARADRTAAVPFGRELTNRQIDALIAAHAPDERRLYRAAGAIDARLPELGMALAHTASHGAHIAGIAAGNDPAPAAPALPDDAQIVLVQLPNTIAWDTSGFGKEAYMLAGVQYILARARMIAEATHQGDGPVEEIPLVLNLSYGWSANRHDGQSGLERGIEELLRARKALQPASAVVMPTGNNFANAMHGRVGAPQLASGAYTIGWQISPDDRTSSYLEIWFPEGFRADGWSVEVTPPAGFALEAGGTLPIAADPALEGGDPRRFQELERGGDNIGQLSADCHSGTRWRVLVALSPSIPEARGRQRCPAGLWQITLRAGATALPDDRQIELWVQRDDDPVALGTGGRQSWLVDLAAPPPPPPLGAEADPLAPVTGFGCLNGIATAASVTRVAGYRQSDGRPAPYSGAAALRANATAGLELAGVAPSVAAVSDQSATRPGLPSIGICSGSGARLVGTSAAAASVTRMMALNLCAGRPLEHGMSPLGSGADLLSTARLGAHIAPPICGSVGPGRS